MASRTPEYSDPWIEASEDRVARPDGSDDVYGVVEVTDGETVAALMLAGIALGRVA